MSKFLRQMTALSKTPADFQPKKPEGATAAAPSKMATVDKLTTVDKLYTVGKTTAPRESTGERIAIDHAGRPVNSKLCKPANLVQHGHTPGEHATYMTLWNSGGSPDRREDFRDVTIGYDRIAAGVGGSKRNMQRLVESLIQKLAIEILQAEDSGIRKGKTYRVYSMTEILRKRREAGYTWVLRNRSAVDLVRMSTVDKLPTVDKLATDDTLSTVGRLTTGTVDRLSTETVDRLTTPLGSSLGTTQETSSSSVTHEPLIARVCKAGISLDDDAARRIVSRCQGADHTATVEEIAYFAELKIQQLARRRNIDNWPGLLMAAIPPYFDPPATELSRYRIERERSREEERRREVDTAEAILGDPDEPESSKQWAREVLKK